VPVDGHGRVLEGEQRCSVVILDAGEGRLPVNQQQKDEEDGCREPIGGGHCCVRHVSWSEKHLIVLEALTTAINCIMCEGMRMIS